jgi:ankyrin repeat protein
LSLTDLNQRGNFGNYPLHIACTRGSLEEAAALLRAGADVNANGELDDRPIHDAVSGGEPAIVRLLIEAGANLNALNALGCSAKSLARAHTNLEIVQLIENAEKQLGTPGDH